MRKTIAICSLLLLAGCAYHPLPVSAYGKSGTQYQAPTLCAALVKCLQTEAACYTDSTTYTTAAGVAEQSGCKETSK